VFTRAPRPIVAEGNWPKAIAEHARTMLIVIDRGTFPADPPPRVLAELRSAEEKETVYHIQLQIVHETDAANAALLPCGVCVPTTFSVQRYGRGAAAY
jgi:hypothetical protein